MPQESVLRPLLYTLYIADIPVQENAVIATFTDYTAVINRKPSLIA